MYFERKSVLKNSQNKTNDDFDFTDEKSNYKKVINIPT